MTEVRINKLEEQLIRNGKRQEALESLLSRFKRVIQESGILKDYKKHEFYEKPSINRARKRRNRIIKSKQQEKRNALYYSKG
mgnify:CR=1 FL=1